jgi:hypothetical protein
MRRNVIWQGVARSVPVGATVRIPLHPSRRPPREEEEVCSAERQKKGEERVARETYEEAYGEAYGEAYRGK